jgi:hypothetical protein
MGLAEVSGFYSNLQKGFHSIGVDAELVTLTQHRFGYGDTCRSIWVRMSHAAVAGRKRHNDSNKLVRLTWTAFTVFTRILLLFWAILRFDIFIFGCASSFFGFLELPLLKLLGKKIIYNFHGTDGRCGFMDGFAEDIFMPLSMREGTGFIGPIRDTDSDKVKEQKLKAYAAITAMRKANVDRIDRYADVVINSPSHGQHHTRPFVQRLIIGMPYMPDREHTARSSGNAIDNEVTILHGPSYPEGKGSPGIRLAIKALQRRGYKINYIEITGRPNREVLELIAQCDFVIDQLYSDMAMVGFATEAAFYSKPAIVGGYYAAHQKSDILPKWIPPTLFCLPEDIEDAIEKLIIDIPFRKELGSKANDFVEKNWLASQCAERFMVLAAGEIPDDWLYDPINCDYLYGMGLSKENLHTIIKGMKVHCGIESFFLGDKPVLKHLIEEFADNPAAATNMNTGEVLHDN